VNDDRYYLIGELVGPLVEIGRRYILVLPLLLAGAGFVFGLATAPAIPDAGAPGWLIGLFGTTAQIIATLFVALALEARWAAMPRSAAALTVGYVAVGEAAAAFGMSSQLPPEAYKWLLGLAVGGGLGGLGAAALLAYKAIAAQLDEDRERRRAELYGRKP
jgi:hypothetical protein